MAKKYIVRLTPDERYELKELVSKGKIAAYKRLHAQILLKADISEQGPGWVDEKISESFGVSTKTIERLRQRFVEKGFEAALNRAKAKKVKNHRLDGEQEAYLVAFACSDAPEGQARWTLRLLADKMVELEYVDSISHETIRQVLKKNKLKPWQKKEWCIPPEANADFVCAMEDVLDVYKRPLDQRYPVVCMDESSKQQIKEARESIPVTPGEPERYDFEYERNGVSNLFIFFDPLAGWRHIEVTDRRTAVDWAYQIRDLVDVYYPEAERITLVMDNLNTHCGASLYKAFEPPEARRILERLDIHYTPKHGSWLNMAEIELSILSRQCLNRRIPDQETLKKEVTAWANSRNDHPSSMDWRFTTEDARIKLGRLYPTIES
jgi:transposase